MIGPKCRLSDHSAAGRDLFVRETKVWYYVRFRCLLPLPMWRRRLQQARDQLAQRAAGRRHSTTIAPPQQHRSIAPCFARPQMMGRVSCSRSAHARIGTQETGCAIFRRQVQTMPERRGARDEAVPCPYVPLPQVSSPSLLGLPGSGYVLSHTWLAPCVYG